MKDQNIESDINKIVHEHDRKNLQKISDAVASGVINEDAGDCLRVLYTDGMDHFREVFNVLYRCFGAPKAAVTGFDISTGCALDETIKISDINPLSPYMVHHRLDADPMRNQFFTIEDNNKINLSVSSIVSVIVGAQKSISRAIDKVTGKYYADYLSEVIDAAKRVLIAAGREASADAIANKIHDVFSAKFITNASETVLGIIGGGHEKISVELVRELDRVRKPHARLQDVWRVKCLFDLMPQARVFIERIREIMPGRTLIVRDSFHNVNHPRNYRDAKIILNIGRGDAIVPMEIICQVRTLFEFEQLNHNEYEQVRKGKIKNTNSVETGMAIGMEAGIQAYNTLVCNCVSDLFERVGWNILYGDRQGEESLFEGFPKISSQYYSTKTIDAIFNNLDKAVTNEVFRVTTAPIKLTPAQEFTIFRWMAKFILVAAMPFKDSWRVPEDDVSGRLFNFIMKELQKHNKK